MAEIKRAEQMVEVPASWVAEVERRLGNLETARRAPYTSITEGGLRWLRQSDLKRRFSITHAVGTPPDEPVAIILADPADPDSDVIFYLGDRGPAASNNCGLTLRDKGAVNLLIDTGDGPGFIRPEWSSSWIRIDASDRVRTANAGFTTAWQDGVRCIYHDLVQCFIAVDSAGGAIGELRATETASGLSTNPKTIPAGFNGTVELKWEHGVPLDSPNRTFVIEQRVTNATGTIGCRPSTNLNHVSSERLPGAAGGWV